MPRYIFFYYPETFPSTLNEVSTVRSSFDSLGLCDDFDPFDYTSGLADSLRAEAGRAKLPSARTTKKPKYQPFVS
jgi:hypothetical protein